MANVIVSQFLVYVNMHLYPLHCNVCVPEGNRVHHARPGAGAASALSQGSVRHDVGLLAERAAATPQH